LLEAEPPQATLMRFRRLKLPIQIKDGWHLNALKNSVILFALFERLARKYLL
jgi:hypothetical protein